MGKFINEFKEFAVKGNAVDMAVGVIIGSAFGKIISSIVNDIIMPPIGWLIGGVNFRDLKVTLPSLDVGIEKLQPATINYGNFLQTTFDFIIIALCVFMLIKGINKMARKKKEEEKKEEKKEEHYLRREFSYSNYSQSYALPENANQEKISAEVSDGVLKIEIPKVAKEEKKDDVKHIEVK